MEREIADSGLMMCQMRKHLEDIGFDDNTIAEAIRLGGHEIPVFGGQLRGCYIDSEGKREAHFAVPGWYEIQSVSGTTVRIKKNRDRADLFEFHKIDLLMVLEPNLMYVDQGLKP